MSLETAYNTIRTSLRAQVQGTCGLYSFYNAVQILRAINPRLPQVPSPKKSEDPRGRATQSLRQYGKRQFQSGQGEILTAAEMIGFVNAWGYRGESCGSDGTAAKSDFLTIQTRADHPVLIAYLADDDPAGGSLIPVLPNAATPDPGPHWSLVIATEGGFAKVIEPNCPGTLMNWSLSTLLLANAGADAKTFTRFWAKTQYWERWKTDLGPVKYEEIRKAHPEHNLPPFGPVGTSVKPLPNLPNPKAWRPSSVIDPYDIGRDIHDTRVYDLGGRTGTRHERQKLAHVLISVLPPA
jgi:hypothetical protein